MLTVATADVFVMSLMPMPDTLGSDASVVKEHVSIPSKSSVSATATS